MARPESGREVVDRPVPARVVVVSPGVQTTVQDLPGRHGYWGVGVPPSGAWDDLAFTLANLAVGNPPEAPGLEAVVTGPSLRFTERTLVCVTGSAVPTVDGRAVPVGEPVTVPAGGLLDVGPNAEHGLRAYVAVRGGLAVPVALGSRSTFLLGAFGGHEGRALAAGDVLTLGRDENTLAPRDVSGLLPAPTGTWTLRVVAGPHGAPAHLTGPGIEEFFAATWTVDHRADRTGIRLVGPAPRWARSDGGEAGMHPSNIHDSAYPVGGIMLAGDTPVIVGPDGPSLGGFVVPAVVVRADHWKLGQLRPGDQVRLLAVTPAEADAAATRRRCLVAEALAGRLPGGDDGPVAAPTHDAVAAGPPRPEVLVAIEGCRDKPSLTALRAGDRHLLVELGPPQLDLAVRLVGRLLGTAIEQRRLDGLTESVEGVRSLLLAVDPDRLPLPTLAAVVADCYADLPDPRDVELAVREVELPILLDDPTVHEAMARYQRGVRPDAPWCPDNVEFIRRVNALDRRSDVFEVVTAATYLVLGLGDVYLGAPVAVPLDPRHRLVTTKYDPARTWTPANAVGIGGVYLCVYGMEGPGGYQLVGRTVPVWRYRPGTDDESPWLLRHFDRLRFRPVTSEELYRQRAEIAAGTRDLQVRAATFRLSDAVVAPEDRDVTQRFLARRDAAFQAERDRWARGETPPPPPE